MKRKSIYILVAVMMFVGISLWINYRKGMFNHAPRVGISMYYNAQKGEMVESHPMSENIALYNKVCNIENSNTLINQSIQGDGYHIFISVSNEIPQMVAKKTEEKGEIKKSKKNNDEYQSPILIYTKDEYSIFRYIQKEPTTTSLIIFDVVSKDSVMIDEIYQSPNYVAQRIIRL